MNRRIYPINPSVGHFDPSVVPPPPLWSVHRHTESWSARLALVFRLTVIIILASDRETEVTDHRSIPLDIDVKGVRIGHLPTFALVSTYDGSCKIIFSFNFSRKCIHTGNGIFKGTIQSNGLCLVFVGPGRLSRKIPHLSMVSHAGAFSSLPLPS